MHFLRWGSTDHVNCRRENRQNYNALPVDEDGRQTCQLVHHQSALIVETRGAQTEYFLHNGNNDNQATEYTQRTGLDIFLVLGRLCLQIYSVSPFLRGARAADFSFLSYLNISFQRITFCECMLSKRTPWNKLTKTTPQSIKDLSEITVNIFP